MGFGLPSAMGVQSQFPDRLATPREKAGFLQEIGRWIATDRQLRENR